MQRIHADILVLTGIVQAEEMGHIQKGKTVLRQPQGGFVLA